jgi:hypothetical protein
VAGPDLSSYITATSTDSLQNKTIDTANNTITVVEADISDLGSYITASSSDTLTNKTIDANGTGNAISNLEVADFAGAAIITVAETLASNDSDTALVTAGAIIDYVDAQDANIASDNLTFTNKTIDANGTGNSITNIEVADLAAGVLDTDLTAVSASDNTLASAKAIKAQLDLKISDVVSDTTPQLGGNLDVNGNNIVSVSNGDIILAPNGTGTVQVTQTELEVYHDTSAVDFNNYGDFALKVYDDGTTARFQIGQYLSGSSVSGSDDNIQSVAIQFDDQVYSQPASSVTGDLKIEFGYNFDNESCQIFAGGGPLEIDAFGHDGNSYAQQEVRLYGSLIGLNSEVEFVKTYKETVTALTSSTSINVDCSETSVSRVALSHSSQFTFLNLPEGRSHTLIIVSSGSYTGTFSDDDSTAIKFPGGAPTLTASGTDVVTVFNTGTEILGNIAQDFQ